MSMHTIEALQVLIRFKDIDRRQFAKTMSYIAGLLAGASIVQLDLAQKAGSEGPVALGYALTTLVSVGIVLHALGHISQRRTEVINACFQAALMALFGALLATVVNLVPQPIFATSALSLGVLVGFFVSGSAAIANFKRPSSNKPRVVSVTAGIEIAHIVFLAALIGQNFV
jgi:hypothetical protein